MKRKFDVVGLLICATFGLAAECLYIWLLLTNRAVLYVFPLWLLALTGIAAGSVTAGIAMKLRYATRGIILDTKNLPASAAEYIKLVVKYMLFCRTARREVADELADHFEEAIKDCANEQEKNTKSQEIISRFGDAKLLAVLMRRAKKRCRPLWQTAIVRSFQATGILVVSLSLYVVWFVNGKAVINVDYLPLLNQMNQSDTADVCNGWPFYEKAISLFIEPNEQFRRTDVFLSVDKAKYVKFADIDSNTQEPIKQWIAENENAWQEFVKGSNQTHCFKKIEYDAENKEKFTYFISFPELSGLRDLYRLGLWRARIWADEGKISNSVDDLLAVAKTGRNWQTRQNSLISYMVAAGITSGTCREIMGLLATYDINDSELSGLAIEINGLFANSFPDVNSESSYNFSFLDMVQHLFTEGGPGGGHLIPSKVRRIADSIEQLPSEKKSFDKLTDYPWEYREKIKNIMFTSRAIEHAGRNNTIATAKAVFHRAAEIARMTPYQRKQAGLNDKMAVLAGLSPRKYLLIYCYQPEWILRASELRFRFIATYEALKTVLAVQLYVRKNGKLPERLEELVESGFLNSLPADPYSDKTLIFRKTENGFTLYSVGPNFIDDGGKAETYDSGNPQMLPSKGDAVFWPVKKN